MPTMATPFEVVCAVLLSLNFTRRLEKPDGHCLYRAVAVRVFTDCEPHVACERHQEVRNTFAAAVLQPSFPFQRVLDSYGGRFASPEAYAEHVKSPGDGHERWGGDLEIEFLVEIVYPELGFAVIHSFDDNTKLTTDMRGFVPGDSMRGLYLAHLGDTHFDSAMPLDERRAHEYATQLAASASTLTSPAAASAQVMKRAAPAGASRNRYHLDEYDEDGEEEKHADKRARVDSPLLPTILSSSAAPTTMDRALSPGSDAPPPPLSYQPPPTGSFDACTAKRGGAPLSNMEVEAELATASAAVAAHAGAAASLPSPSAATSFAGVLASETGDGCVATSAATPLDTLSDASSGRRLICAMDIHGAYHKKGWKSCESGRPSCGLQTRYCQSRRCTACCSCKACGARYAGWARSAAAPAAAAPPPAPPFAAPRAFDPASPLSDGGGDEDFAEGVDAPPLELVESQLLFEALHIVVSPRVRLLRTAQWRHRVVPAAVDGGGGDALPIRVAVVTTEQFYLPGVSIATKDAAAALALASGGDVHHHLGRAVLAVENTLPRVDRTWQQVGVSTSDYCVVNPLAPCVTTVVSLPCEDGDFRLFLCDCGDGAHARAGDAIVARYHELAARANATWPPTRDDVLQLCEPASAFVYKYMSGRPNEQQLECGCIHGALLKEFVEDGRRPAPATVVDPLKLAGVRSDAPETVVEHAVIDPVASDDADDGDVDGGARGGVGGMHDDADDGAAIVRGNSAYVLVGYAPRYSKLGKEYPLIGYLPDLGGSVPLLHGVEFLVGGKSSPKHLITFRCLVCHGPGTEEHHQCMHHARLLRRVPCPGPDDVEEVDGEDAERHLPRVVAIASRVPRRCGVLYYTGFRPRAPPPEGGPSRLTPSACYHTEVRATPPP